MYNAFILFISYYILYETYITASAESSEICSSWKLFYHLQYLKVY